MLSVESGRLIWAQRKFVGAGSKRPQKRLSDDHFDVGSKGHAKQKLLLACRKPDIPDL
jgi:hypothetical protein